MSNRNIPINITWLKNETFENPLNIYQHVAYLPEFSNKSINDILQYFIKVRCFLESVITLNICHPI